jgi:hypothetical protein
MAFPVQINYRWVLAGYYNRGHSISMCDLKRGSANVGLTHGKNQGILTIRNSV